MTVTQITIPSFIYSTSRSDVKGVAAKLLKDTLSLAVNTYCSTHCLTLCYNYNHQSIVERQQDKFRDKQ